jgi:hypothetical protein
MVSQKRIKERKMKKFSWIFALILALSIGFIGCPTDPTPEKKGGGDDNPSGFVPNPDAVEIPVVFGTSEDETVVKIDKRFGSGEETTMSNIGSVSYTGGAYTYVYGTEENNGYSNAVVRFKVNLGDFRLGDYGGVSFKWKGIDGDVGLSSGNITYTKNLYILGSKEEDDLTAGIGITNDATIKDVVVNTDYFTKEANASSGLDAGAVDVPHVKALAGYPTNQLPAGVTEPYPIATPIVLNKTIRGEIWLGFYFHASGGSYSISDFKLIPAASFTKVDPPAAPVAEPPVPADIPAGFKKIELDLSVANCSDVTDSGAGINSTLPSLTYADGVLTVPFTQNNQRLNVKLSEADKTKYYANSDAKDVYIQIACTIDGTDNEDNFRYHLGIISTGSGWNATNGSGDFPLLKWKGDAGGIAVSATGKGLKQTDAKKDTKAPAADYFIFQYRGQAGATVKISSIALWVPGTPKGPTVDIALTAATLGKNNVTATDITGGVQITTTQGYCWAWSYFKVELPAGKTIADYETLSYTIKSIEVGGLDDGTAWKSGLIFGFDTLAEIEAIIAAGAVEATANTQELDPTKAAGHPGGDIAKAHQLAANGAAATGTQNHGVDYPHDVKLNTKAAPNGLKDESVGLTQTANEFYIVFSWGGSAGMKCELKNVKLIAGVED